MTLKKKPSSAASSAKTSFLESLASPLVDELRAIEGVKRLTSNTDVIGAHAEAAVRSFVSRVVYPLRVSTGAVIDEHLPDSEVPQVDTIVWLPCPAPALFEVGHFGLVPRSSAMAIMEIKRSAYAGVGEALRKRLASKFVKKTVADDPPGWVGTADPALYPDFPALGVVCVRETKSKDKHLDKLIETGRAVVLFDLTGEPKVNAEGAWRLVNFLVRARARARLWDGAGLANIAQLRR